MSNPNMPDYLDAEHEQNQQERIEAVELWAEYIQSEPPERWGPQQITVVNDQLYAADVGGWLLSSSARRCSNGNELFASVVQDDKPVFVPFEVFCEGITEVPVEFRP